MRKLPRNRSHRAEPPQEVSPERRQLTVMFCDLVGSTPLSVEFDPEDVANAIRAYHASCTKIVARWDGHIAKFMGDGVLVYFGWPRAHEDDAERAVQAGLELTSAVATLDTAIGRPIAARVGIATGLVMVGETTGAGTAREQAVVGETPNLAARLQGIAEPGTVVVASSTRKLLGNLFKTTELGEQSLKGFAEPVRAWCVTGKEPKETRFEALHGGLRTPLIGRDDEVELLMKRFQQAEAGEGQVVLISGEPGIGKSRLCEALRARLLDRPHTRLTYQCSPSHTDRAFYPLVMQLEQAADIRPDLDPGEKLRRLAAMLPDVRSTAPRSNCRFWLPFSQYRRMEERGRRASMRLNRRSEPLMCLRASWKTPAPKAPRFSSSRTCTGATRRRSNFSTGSSTG